MRWREFLLLLLLVTSLGYAQAALPCDCCVVEGSATACAACPLCAAPCLLSAPARPRPSAVPLGILAFRLAQVSESLAQIWRPPRGHAYLPGVLPSINPERI